MLSNLTERLAGVVKTLRGQARITEANTADILREIRIALLEADVGLPVIKELLARIKEQASGEAVLQSLTPGQMMVGIVHRELARILGSELPREARQLQLEVKPPAVILMAGLQGAGKTTTCGKLARLLKAQKKKVLLVSIDVYRPAAMQQLAVLAQQVGVELFPTQADQAPTAITEAALAFARLHYFDVLIIDSAGRLTIDAQMMAEIAAVHQIAQPSDTLFVLDALMGQEAVNTARGFHTTLPLTGIIVTKMDSDARGGAALSALTITGCPILYLGVSEKIDGLQPFDPDRMAQRLLGMGDMLALFEQAREQIDLDTSERLAQKLKKGQGFDLNDFRQQLNQMDKMGGLQQLMGQLPSAMQGGFKTNDPEQVRRAEKSMGRMRGIIDAMTPQERLKPELIKASRKRRIALGAGAQVQEVNRLLQQFDSMQGMMKKMKGPAMLRQMKAMMQGRGV